MMMKSTRSRITLGLSVAALAIGGMAYAQSDAAPNHGMHLGDADGNGVVTRAEAQAAATAMFTRMDVNKDGKLDKADRAAGRAAMQDRMFEKLDTDKNGAISKSEFAAHHGPDRDGPGRDHEGMGHGAMGHGAMGHGAMGNDMADGPKGPGKGGMRGHRMGGGMMMMARMADTDKDGALSQAEFTAAAAKHFDMADANHDGQITAAERQAMHEKMKAEWQAKK